ncbi:MAG: class I SAM-dependent methyltransferase [Phycisphaeraceae bacterium]|nr:class I SAM-dependent methyltransferase [Phycisphaeraceae bacterium]
MSDGGAEAGLSGAAPSAPNEVPIPSFGPERMALYERATEKLGPREWLVKALDQHSITRASGGRIDVLHALDLGCGLGQEAEFLLSSGWRVVATDASARMLAATRARAERLAALDRLELVHAPFENTPLPVAAFHLVHAGFALPFCPEHHFEALWARLAASLAPGGLFVGQLFGPRDQFVVESDPGTMSAHTAVDLPRLFESFDLLAHEEVEREGEPLPGVRKRWHVHHLVARRRS